VKTFPLSAETLTKNGILKRFHRVKLSDYYGAMKDWRELKKIFYSVPETRLRREWLEAQKIYNLLVFYRDNLPKAINLGKGLFLHGKSGTGKSLLLMAIARHAMSIGIRTKVLTAQGIINFFARSWQDKEISFEHSIMSVPFLCIEELYKENFTSLNVPTLTRVVKYREEAQLATCFTCNESLLNIAKNYSEALASAITGCCRVIEFDSKLDWRTIMQENWRNDILKG
jgi:DNA replication protein DnaC